MRHSTHRAAMLAFGLMLVFNAGVRADEAASGRDTIIEGVRDDVRRKIQERNEIPAENRPDVASEVKGPANPAPAVQGDQKQDKPK